MDDRLHEMLMRLPRKNLVNLMWDALDHMQAYNGRTPTQCIVMAIGGEVDDEGKCSVSVGFGEIKKNTEEMGI
jgi:hypothetical protein